MYLSCNKFTPHKFIELYSFGSSKFLRVSKDILNHSSACIELKGLMHQQSGIGALWLCLVC